VATFPRTRYALAVGTLVTLSNTSQAQSARSLVGSVKDSLGHAIGSAEVRSLENVFLARSDDSGQFRVAQMPDGAGDVEVRRLGFSPKRAAIARSAGTTDSIQVTLRAMVQELPEITVQEQHELLSRKVLASFWERRSRGFGKFVTRDEIEQRGSNRFIDVVRAVPSVTVMNYRGRQEIRFRGAGIASMIRDCPPQYWMDGIPLENGSAEEFSPQNVEAIELYASPATTPPQFTTRSQTCGTVVVWTRLPG
jgi:hypothetical protein